MSGKETTEIVEAFRYCREIARREAKNFYWAFRALPPHKSDAMCAVYAFMRKADDLADDETLSLEARRTAMHDWTAAWRHSREGESVDPLFAAVNAVQQRFAIPTELLEQLVAGTTLDLQPRPEGVCLLQAGGLEYQVYESFADLYRYCYLVASVVGLVTIRIFGYTDSGAEKLAEYTGIAFQLTNILRDVREDAERGRVYLPREELHEAQVPLDSLLEAALHNEVSPRVQRLMARQVERAGLFYAAGERLLPLIEPDARPAMRVLITIYQRLLERIAADPAAVFSGRVSVPTSQKLAILGRGLAAAAWARRV